MIAVTGASGHLGRWVVRRLADRGEELLCISRRPGRRSSVRGLDWPDSARSLCCDLADRLSVESAAAAWSQVEAVVHLAAVVPDDTARNSDLDFEQTLHANALGTARLLHALRGAAKLRTVVYASTFEVYGPPATLPIDEDHATIPLSYYGAGKLAGEKYLSLFSQDRGLPCASLRLPAIYGPGDVTRRAIGNFIRASSEGRDLVIQGDGADRRDLVYAGDAAEAIALAIDRRAGGVLNVGSGTGFTILEMAEAARRAGGGSSRIIHRERVKPGVDYALDIRRARSVLGWEPRTSLDEGIRAQLDWIRDTAGHSES